MKVKRYVVGSLPEALPIIRSELGVDAVILNTKEIRVGGFLGMFGKKKMEVIAAIESGPAAGQPAKPKSQQRPAAKPASPNAGAAANAMAVAAAPAPARAAYAKSSAKAASPSAPQNGYAEAAAKPASPSVPQNASGRSALDAALLAAAAAESARPLSPAYTKESPFADPQAAAKRRVAENELMDEIRDMKQWIVRISKQQQLDSRPAALQALYDRLLDQEVEAAWIDRLIEEVEQRLQGREPERQAVWEEARRLLLEWLKDAGGHGIDESTRVLHFVGPTGVGKTTSIAKLAAEQTLKAGRKVGFITADTYRIAAVDQLRTYATILDVPLEVVFSPAEVARAFKQLEDRELIFMDTAGRNFRNELYVSEVNSLLQSGDTSNTYLVLGMTGRYKDMSAVADNFAKYGVRNVIFTKQDETSAYGIILNLVLEHGLKPVYIAYGQTVPDDIAPFRPERYVDQILGAGDDD